MIQALQLILALSFLVLIHELGHFTFAKIFHVRVEKFYMFFNPWISLFKMKKFNGKWHFRFFSKNEEDLAPDTDLTTLPEDDWRRYPDNTEWGIGWLPFGGYCAIGGMVDETHKSEDLAAEPQPWEFRSKPAWQRFFIILGGILVNFIAAMVIFSMIIWSWGTDTLPLKNVTDGLYYSQELLHEGFRQHDQILSIDGEEPEELADIVQWVVLEGKRNVVVLRGQDTVRLTMSEDLGTRCLAVINENDRIEREKERQDNQYQRSRYVLIQEYVPFVVDSVLPGNVADLAGLQRGDSIVSIDSVKTDCQALVQLELKKHPLDSITIGYYRNGEYRTAAAFVGDQCKLGVVMKDKTQFYQVVHTDYSFLEAVPAGIAHGWETLENYVGQMRIIFTKEGARSVGGFGAIGSMFPPVWNWYAFWYMTAFLSLILAFMNFLPIPALDGGYILFLIVEMITRRKPSDKFLETANQVGFWLLLALLIFANGNDILRFFF